ncbi:MAG: hypothetical protein ACLFTT_10690, partial [Candidatus Hydrogenedentota bacterium]
ALGYRRSGKEDFNAIALTFEGAAGRSWRGDAPDGSNTRRIMPGNVPVDLPLRGVYHARLVWGFNR